MGMFGIAVELILSTFLQVDPFFKRSYISKRIDIAMGNISRLLQSFPLVAVAPSIGKLRR